MTPRQAGFVLAARQRWTALYRRRPPWEARHEQALCAALDKCGTPDDALASWEFFLLSDRSYFQGHSPTLFVKHLDQFVTMRGPGRAEEPDFAEIHGICWRCWRLGKPDPPKRTRGPLCEPCAHDRLPKPKPLMGAPRPRVIDGPEPTEEERQEFLRRLRELRKGPHEKNMALRT